MITLLQKYLAINTAHPRPAYHAACALLQAQALADGFVVQQIALPSGNPVLIITLPGSSPELPALALNHHMDVVPADNADAWKFPPFAGAVHNGIIYGRGTQDCKGLGIAQYAALRKLKQSAVVPQRTVHCLIVPDEERGGFYGTKEFVEHPAFTALNIGYVLDEGVPSGAAHELLIKVAERTPLQIRVTSAGEQSHASGLQHYNCVHALTNFLASVVALQTEQQARASEQAGNLISLQVTSLTTNTSVLNVIPSEAQATIDVRVPASMPLVEGIALLDALIQQHAPLTYEIVATSTERFATMATDTMFYQAVAQAVADHGLAAAPFAFEATTDARFYSHRGIAALGFTPFTAMPQLHATDEQISSQDFEQGIDILHTFLRAFCTITK